jgi:hypothetical protein
VAAMLPQNVRIGYPIGSFRIIAFFVTAFSVGLLIFLASLNLGYFSLVRLLYLLFGIAAGIFLGVFEARTVIPKLKESTEALVWIILPIGIVLFALPWFFVTQVFGASEYLPFGIYAFFPFFVSVLGSSGWYFSKFEKENNVRLFVFVYGIRYWKEKNPGIGDRFYHFIRDLVSKDFSALYLHVGYSKLYLQELSKKENIDSSTKQMLQQILDVMKKYRRIFLSIYAGFMIAMPLLVLWLFVLTSTHTFGMQQVIAHRIVSGREITIVLGVTPFVAVFGGIFGALLYARGRFRKSISILLAKADYEKLSSL